MSNKDSTIFSFILREKYVTLTVLGSIFTFAFVNSMKRYIIDPVFQLIFSEEKFGFMNVVVKEGEAEPIKNTIVEFKFGSFFREFCTWVILMFCLYALYMFTEFPDHTKGSTGAAIM